MRKSLMESCSAKGQVSNELATLLFVMAMRVDVRSRERDANAKNAANITFRMAAAPSVHSYSPNCLALSVALFCPCCCVPTGPETKQITQAGLAYRPSATHDSPDIVISGGHFLLRYQSLRRRNARRRFLGVFPQAFRNMQLESFDSTGPRNALDQGAARISGRRYSCRRMLSAGPRFSK